MYSNFRAAKEALAPYVGAGGMCSDRPEVALYINEACERLIDSGKWKGLITKVAFCHRAGTITLPRDVETVLEAADCGYPVAVNNEWYEFLPGGPYQMSQCNSWAQMVDRGDNWPTVYDLTGKMLIRVYSDLSTDNDKTILFQGTEENGNRVQTQSGDEYVDGEVFTLNSATPSLSTVVWTKIECVQKELTTGYVRVYQVNPETMQNAGLLAVYHPNDEFPAFRRLFYGGYCWNNDGDGNVKEAYHPLTFLCKKRHVALVRDTDMVPITAAGALKNMVMAIWYERNNQRTLADQYETKAVQCLQNELKQSQGAQVHMNVKIPGFFNYPAVRSFR